jgi:hypothetical protein
MPRRPNRGKGRPVSANCVIHGRQDGTGRAQNSCPAVPAEDGIQEERSTASGTHRFESGEILSGVDSEQRITAARLRLDDFDSRLASRASKDGTQPCGGFGVIRSGIVL